MDSLGHRTDFGKTCVVKTRLAVVCLTVFWTTAWALPAAAQVAPLSARSVAVDLSPPVTHVAIRGAGGSVSDWAVR
jgi:hypothetical protein